MRIHEVRTSEVYSSCIGRTFCILTTKCNINYIYQVFLNVGTASGVFLSKSCNLNSKQIGSSAANSGRSKVVLRYNMTMLINISRQKNLRCQFSFSFHIMKYTYIKPIPRSFGCENLKGKWNGEQDFPWYYSERKGVIRR